MITINILCVGNLKEKFWREAEEEYKKRLSRFCKLNIIEVEERNFESTTQITLSKEGKDIISKAKGYIVLMDRLGKVSSSEQLAEKIEKIGQTSSEITFVVGSSCGVSDEVRKRANELLSFGSNTFPHNLFRIMLLEQVYRSFCIIGGIKYHK